MWKPIPVGSATCFFASFPVFMISPCMSLKITNFSLPPAMALKVTACEDMQGLEKTFCSSVLGDASGFNMAHYKALRKECTWKPFAGEFTSYVSVSGSRNVEFSNIAKYQASQTSHYATSCKIKVPDDKTKMPGNETMHIFRLGPFYSDGDVSKWYRWGMDNLMPEYNGMKIGIQRYLQAAVDAHGNILGYPPLQIHHNHFSDLQCNQVKKMWGFSRLVEEDFDPFKDFFPESVKMLYGTSGVIPADTHADKECKQSMGGTDCLIRVWPPEFSVQMPPMQTSGCVFADYVDVRPANSSRMKWWAELMLGVTTTLQKQLFMDMVGIDTPRNSYLPFGDEFLMNSNNQTILWTTYRFPRDGHVVLVLKHTHRLMTDDFMLVRGHPDVLGLSEMNYLDQQTALGRDISPHLADHKRKLLTHIAALESKGLAKLVCAMHNEINVLENASGYLVDRMHPMPCAGWNFHRNELYTTIIFLQAQTGFTFPKNKFLAGHGVFYVHSISAEV